MYVVTLLTDFGGSDYYVAAVKGVLLGAAPGVTLVDVSHEVPPGDVETASFLLAAAAPAFPPGTVHLAVVDPGVGSGRRILAVEAGDARFLAPDNGLLTPFLLAASRVVAVDRPDLYRRAPGATFHGRDRFAPLAAALVRGEPLERLGRQIDDPVRLSIRQPRRGGDAIHGRVAHVDRYGNLVTDLPSSWLDVPRGAAIDAEVDGKDRSLRGVSTYAELPAGTPGLLVGSLGTFEISLRDASLAVAWGVARGAAVSLRPSAASDRLV